MKHTTTAYRYDSERLRRMLRCLVIAAAFGIGTTTFAQEILNGAFQSQDEFTRAPGYARDNPEITGWNYEGRAGINPGRDFNSFIDNGAQIVGNKVAFLHGNSSLSQVVNRFEKGAHYTISFVENARAAGWNSRKPPLLTVKVGNDIVVPMHAVKPVGGEQSYTVRLSDPFTATASSLEITFTNSVQEGEDAAVLIDDVVITKVEVPVIGEAFLGDERLLVYEGFDYPGGQELLIARASGIGWNGNYRYDDVIKDFSPAMVASPGFCKSALVCEGNRIVIRQRGSLRAIDMEKMPLRFTSVIGEALRNPGESIWLSFLAQHDTKEPKSGFFGISLFHVMERPSLTNEVLFIGVGRDETTWKLGGFAATHGDTSIPAGELALLVVRIDWNDDGANKKPDTAYLWVNPHIDQEYPTRATADATCVRSGPFAFNWVGFRGKGAGSLDEFRIGTSFRSVVPSSEKQ